MCSATIGSAGRRLNAEHATEVVEIDGNAAAAQLLLDIRAFGRIPKRMQGGDPAAAAERSFEPSSTGENMGRFTAENEAELAAMLDQLLQDDDQLMEDLRAYGRVPKDVGGNDFA